MNFSYYGSGARSAARTKCAKQKDLTISNLAENHLPHVRKNTQKGYLTLLRHLGDFASGLRREAWGKGRENVRNYGTSESRNYGGFGTNGLEIPVEVVTEEFCEQFAEYLLDKMRPNSACTHLQKLRTLLQFAVRKGLIERNPMPSASRLIPRYTAPERCYLLPEEVGKLERTRCRHEMTKWAFLFACHTGLRLSDIETLRWSDIKESHGRYLIVKVQVKTQREVRIPLDRSALKILKKMQESDGFDIEGPVFKMYSRTMVARDLQQWGEDAGLSKHLSFHVSRHTFATLITSCHCDIFVVSELCGHTSVKTTQIYARLMDPARFQAVDLMDVIFPIKGGKIVLRL